MKLIEEHAARSRRGPVWLLAVLVALTGLMTLATGAFADSPIEADPQNPGAPSGDGIEPVEYLDNPTCSDFDSTWFELKVEPVADGTYSDGTLEVTINVDNTDDGQVFDWTSNIGIDAVFVKGGNNGNLYTYDPPAEDTGDTMLHASINPSNNMYYGLSHISFCYDLELDVTKTAKGTFDRTITWELDKSVVEESYSGFPGDTFTPTWTIKVTKNVVEDNYAVSGSITIDNPAPFDVDFSVDDVIDGSINADVTCPADTVPKGGQIVCTYVADEDDGIDGTQSENVATVTSLTEGVEGDSDTAAINFTANVIGDETVTVDDDYDPEGKFSTNISDSETFTYQETLSCSTNENDYTNGVDEDKYPNTATVDGDNTDLEDSEEVVVTCYIPLVSKDVTPAWEQDFQWDIFKNVDNTTFVGFVGDAWVFNYDIDLVLTSYEELNFSASGEITVVNPHPTQSMTVALDDEVSNGSTFPGVITPDVAGDCDFDGTDLVVPANSTSTCDYTVDMGDEQDANKDTTYTNTATATIGGTDFDGTAMFTFNDVDPTLATGSEPAEVNVTDDNAGIGEGHEAGPFPETTNNVITYAQNGTCPTDTSLYTNGVYELTLTNVADIVETTDSDTETVTITCYIPAKAKVIKTTTEGPDDIGQFPFKFELYDPDGALVETKELNAAGEVTFDADLEDEGTWTVKEILPDGWVSQDDSLECTFEVAFPGSADTTYECSFDNKEMSRVDLLKLTNGEPTTNQTWTFEIYDGPDGFGTTALASDSTPPALLDFGDLNLDPDSTYTLCELEVPAGYSTFWQIDTDGNGSGDVTVVPYNPNADDDEPGDVGNRCVDIGDGTNISLEPGDTLHFVVDNQKPGGAPRTPGYWKNWNRCTGGNQQFTADANGGWEEGFWLLEDVLDPEIGGGIVWDDILDDDLLFPITDCEDAVLILDKRDLDGKKQASDPLHNLATHLLAAQLNFGAGACTTQDVLDAALEAEELLDKYNFDGYGHDQLKKKDPDAQLANDLAEYLDDYNNGEFCGDDLEE